MIAARSCLLLLVLIIFGNNLFGQQQVVYLDSRDIIYSVEPKTDSGLTELFEFCGIAGRSRLAVVDSTTAYVATRSEIYWLDSTSNSVELIVESSGVDDIILDPNGDLIFTGRDGVQRLDQTTGNVTTLFDDSFFSPGDLALAQDGTIYVVEFFDGLGVLNPNGEWSTLGNWGANELDKIELGIDGFLYGTSFLEGELYRIDPKTGAGALLGSGLFSNVANMKSGADGLLYMAARYNVDGKDGLEDAVFTIDPGTMEVHVLVSDLGQSLSPGDIALFDGNFHAAEPVVLSPNTVVTVRGEFVNGDLDDVEESDDNYFIIRRSNTDVQAVTAYEFEFTSQSSRPSFIEVTTESNTLSRSTVRQSLMFYNFDSGQFESIGSTFASRLTDRVWDVSTRAPFDNELHRFVEDGTNRVRAKMEYSSTNPRLTFSSSVDQITFKIQ